MLTRSQARRWQIQVPSVAQTVEDFERSLKSSRRARTVRFCGLSYDVLTDREFDAFVRELFVIFRNTACTQDGEMVLCFRPDSGTEKHNVKLVRGQVTRCLRTLLGDKYDSADLGIELSTTDQIRLNQITGTLCDDTYITLCGVDKDFCDLPWYTDYDLTYVATGDVAKSVRESLFRDFVCEVAHAYRVTCETGSVNHHRSVDRFAAFFR